MYKPLQTKENRPSSVDYTIGAEASNVISVTAQLRDANGAKLTQRVGVTMYLSNSSNGSDFEPASANLSVAAGSAGKISETATDNTFLVITDATGKAVLDITETGANTMYLVTVLPDGTLDVSDAITFA